MDRNEDIHPLDISEAFSTNFGAAEQKEWSLYGEAQLACKSGEAREPTREQVLR